jgi:hypothetical protein
MKKGHLEIGILAALSIACPSSHDATLVSFLQEREERQREH